VRHVPETHRQRALRILWPAFVIAGCLDGLVFSVVDPLELRWFGGDLIGGSALVIYTVTFLIFWALVSLSGAVTLLLMLERDEINRDPPF
jgi:hypothetical protein